MTTLSDAQLGQIADAILVARDRTATKLPTPTTTGPDPFRAALDSVATDADFSDAGIGVIDFTDDPLDPNVWVHNPAKPVRIGSASKIGMMLAAVQLRLDVRSVLGLNIIAAPGDFDSVFGNPKLWRKAKPPQTQMQPIAATPPLISKIFDFEKTPVDFAGPDPDGRRDEDGNPVAAAQDAIVNKLPADGELSWATWSALTFSERLWLSGCLSDNVAATACVSQIGVPFIKAVMRSYGLFDPANGMSLFPSYGYDTIPRTSKAPAPAPPRALTNVEPIPVTDYWWDPGTHGFTDQKSWVPGSAGALTAYMLALMGDTFADPSTLIAGGGIVACETLRRNLADGGPHAIVSFLVEGVRDIDGNMSGGIVSAGAQVTKQTNKIGILRQSDGAKSALNCEFVYVETSQVHPPANGRNAMKYAVIAVGLISEAATGGLTAAEKSAALGAAIHNALLTL
jgi:hypothetical protein